MSTLTSLQATEDDLLYLRSRWRTLTSRHPADGAKADEWFGVLTTHYSNPDRHYHNLHHVAEILRLLEEFEESAADYTAVCFAAWFHDAVYDTRKQTNEEESAALAERALVELGVPPDRIDAARRLILATKKHEADGGSPDAGLFLDADLSILGAPEATYFAYREAIRREYSWVPKAAYREGRSKVLATFLRRERLFYTDPIAVRFEARARSNMLNEIRALSS